MHQALDVLGTGTPYLYSQGASTLAVGFTMKLEHSKTAWQILHLRLEKQQQIVGNQKNNFTVVHYFKQLKIVI